MEIAPVAGLMLGVNQFGLMPLGFWIAALTALALWQARRRLGVGSVLAGGAGGALFGSPPRLRPWRDATMPAARSCGQ